MMQRILITILLVVVSLNISTTTAQCTKRDVIVGTGYNLIYGNPQAQQDPGLRRTNQILQISYRLKLNTTIRERTICIPDQATIIPITFCSYEEETKFFAGTSSYRSELERNVKVTGGADYGLSEFSFSLSDDYKKVEKSTSSKRNVYFDKLAFCYISQQRYRIANIPYKNLYGVSEEFYNAFQSLPLTKPNKNDSDDKYYDFLRNWGTHIIVKATMGGRYLERSVSTLQKLYEFAEKTDKSSISSSGSYEGYTASLDIDLNTLNSKTKSNTTFGQKKVSLTIGSTVTKGKDGWLVPEKDKNVPEPAEIELISISEVCDYDGYWDTLQFIKKKNLSIYREPLITICNNVKYALKTYVENLMLKNTPEILKIALIWPDSTYGLPKPKRGCPNQKSLKFETGYRRQKTKGLYTGRRNYWSKNIHLAGRFTKRKNIRHEFCMKTKYYVQDKDHYGKWSKGNYCIYKKGRCPVGFKRGYIKWFSYGGSKGGSMPDGFYGQKTIIKFCCRRDAYSYTVPIILPNHHPFYLIRIGGYCQTVKGMKVNEEFVEWKVHHKKGKFHPDIDGGRYATRLYFCYYTKSSYSY